MNVSIPPSLTRYCEAVASAGGRVLLVGGLVRDALLGIESKDIDVEVYGLALGDVKNLLREHADGGHVNAVGVSFGVLKVRFDGHEIDVSLPRLDSKRGIGHKGFVPELRSDLTPEEAAARRDFTINAMMYDPLSREVVDPHGGAEDLRQRRLRATTEAFKEDPLRVLRGFQFAARFEMSLHENVVQYAEQVRPEFFTLAPERLWGEWQKWAEKSVKPSAGLEALRASGWLSLFPEIDDLQAIVQDPYWHPEGNAYVHTLHVCDAMAGICRDRQIAGDDRAVLMLAALCHDFGKATTTAFIDGRWRAPGHAEASVPLAENFLKQIGCFPRIIRRVLPLVKEHMSHIGFDVTPRTVRRLANRMGDATIRELSLVVLADMSGRPPLSAEQSPAMEAILKQAEQESLGAAKVPAVVRGRDLIDAFEMPAGPEMGALLKRLYERQLDGEFATLDEALSIVRSEMA